MHAAYMDPWRLVSTDFLIKVQTLPGRCLCTYGCPLLCELPCHSCHPPFHAPWHEPYATNADGEGHHSHDVRHTHT